jgi:hypothetical protein
MTETKDEGKRREEIRVVDRRAFTPAGEKRVPDAPPEEAALLPQGAPAPRGAASRERPARHEASAPPPPPAREDQLAAAHFKNLVLNLASSAAASLGEMSGPMTGQADASLEGARQIIDLLQALRIKTRGNLTPEEGRLLDDVIYDLQAEFVSRQTKASRRP